MVFGALFQGVMTEPAWQRKYLKTKNAAATTRALRFRELHDLRLAAGHYIFQGKLRVDSKTPPTEYTTLMTESMGWTHGGTEETNYLLSSDRHQSGLHVLSSIYAAQLAAQLTKDFGEDWWSKGETGKWLKDVWKLGYTSTMLEDLTNVWQIGDADPEAVFVP
jgi:hypothetical protein